MSRRKQFKPKLVKSPYGLGDNNDKIDNRLTHQVIMQRQDARVEHANNSKANDNDEHKNREQNGDEDLNKMNISESSVSEADDSEDEQDHHSDYVFNNNDDNVDDDDGGGGGGGTCLTEEDENQLVIDEMANQVNQDRLANKTSKEILNHSTDSIKSSPYTISTSRSSSIANEDVDANTTQADVHLSDYAQMYMGRQQQSTDDFFNRSFDLMNGMPMTTVPGSDNNTSPTILFNCKICGKGFKHRRSLNRHVKLHTGEKHFKCMFCDTAFARSDHLKAHLRTHNNSKPFKCSICQCGYSTQSALKVHTAHHHHQKNRHKCLNCCKEFESKFTLEEHIYSVHEMGLVATGRVVDETTMGNQMATNRKQVHDVNDNDNNKEYNECGLNGSQLSETTSPTANGNANTTRTSIVSVNDNDDNDQHSQLLGNNHVCKICSNAYINESALKAHLVDDHNVTDNQHAQQLFVCKQCHTCLTNKTEFDVHVRKCTQDAFYQQHSHHRVQQQANPYLNQVQHNKTPILFGSTSTINKRPRIDDQYLANLAYYNGKAKTSPPQYLRQPPMSGMLAHNGLSTLHQLIQAKSQTYCDLCQMNLLTPENFMAHMKIHQAVSSSTLPNHLLLNGSAQGQTPSSSSAPSVYYPVDDQTLLNDYANKESQYWCADCDLNFIKSVDYTDHIRNEHATEVYHCVLCNNKEVFENLAYLKKHFMQVHGSKQIDVYKCKTCASYQTRNLGDFVQHVRTSHINIDNQKPKSPTRPPPMQVHHQQYKCGFCQTILLNETDLRQHMTEHEQNAYKCMYCASTMFSSHEALNKHIELNHQAKTTNGSRHPIGLIRQLKCQICDQQFLSEDLLNTHKQIIHKIGGLQNLADHHEHQQQSHNHHHHHHHKQQQQQQSDGFASTVHQQHQQHHQQQQQQQQQHTCRICLHNFTNKLQLEKHMRIHSSTVDLKCNICDQQFDSVNSLNDHKLIHSKTMQHHHQSNDQVKNSSSTYANDTFVDLNNETSPIAANNSPKTRSVNCAYCKQAISGEYQFREHHYKHNSTLSNAIMVNTNCIVCRQVLNSESDLNIHIRYHLFMRSTHGLKCSACNCTIDKKKTDTYDYRTDTKTGRVCVLCKTCLLKYGCSNTGTRSSSTTSNISMQSNMVSPKAIPSNRVEYLNDYYYCCTDSNSKIPTAMQQQQQSHSSLSSCDKCNIKYDNLLQLKHHYETAHLPNDNTNLAKNRSVESAMNNNNNSASQISQGPKMQIYMCIKCQQNFPSEAEVLEHVKIHIRSTTNGGKLEEVCEICNSVFYTPVQLQSHLLSKHEFPNGVYTCPVCDELFAKADSLFAHTIGHGASAKLYKCQYCDQNFVFKSQLVNHSYTHNNMHNTNQRSIDNYTSSNNRTMQTSSSTAANIPPPPPTVSISMLSGQVENIKSEKIDYIDEFVDISERQPTLKVKEEEEECVLNDNAILSYAQDSIETARKADDTNQQATNNDSSSYSISNNCSLVHIESFPMPDMTDQSQQKTYLDDSISPQNGIRIRKTNLLYCKDLGDQLTSDIKCVLCNQIFDTQQHLQEHFVNIHTNRTSEQTDYSAKDVNQSAQRLLESMDESTTISSTFNETLKISKQVHNRPLNADNRKSRNKMNTFANIDIPLDQQDAASKSSTSDNTSTPLNGLKIFNKYFYNCDKCKVQFKSLKDYQAHLQAHNKQNDNISCHICNKAFASTRNLNVHLRLHTGFRPFKCEICDRRFTRKENLRSHMKCHLGIRPFMCPVCSKSFGRKSHVLTHLEVHLKSKVHKCNICFLEFDSLDIYIKHRLSDHQFVNHSESNTGSMNYLELGRKVNEMAKKLHAKNIGIVQSINSIANRLQI